MITALWKFEFADIELDRIEYLKRRVFIVFENMSLLLVRGLYYVAEYTNEPARSFKKLVLV